MSGEAFCKFSKCSIFFISICKTLFLPHFGHLTAKPTRFLLCIVHSLPDPQILIPSSFPLCFSSPCLVLIFSRTVIHSAFLLQPLPASAQGSTSAYLYFIWVAYYLTSILSCFSFHSLVYPLPNLLQFISLCLTPDLLHPRPLALSSMLCLNFP